MRNNSIWQRQRSRNSLALAAGLAKDPDREAGSRSTTSLERVAVLMTGAGSPAGILPGRPLHDPIRPDSPDADRVLPRAPAGAMRTHEVRSSEPPSTTWSACSSASPSRAGLERPPAGARLPGVLPHPRPHRWPRCATSATPRSSSPASSWSTSSGARSRPTTTCASARSPTTSCPAWHPSDSGARGDVFARDRGALPGLRARPLRDQLRRDVPRRRADRARLHALAAHARRAGRPVAPAPRDRRPTTPDVKSRH